MKLYLFSVSNSSKLPSIIFWSDGLSDNKHCANICISFVYNASGLSLCSTDRCKG